MGIVGQQRDMHRGEKLVGHAELDMSTADYSLANYSNDYHFTGRMLLPTMHYFRYQRILAGIAGGIRIEARRTRRNDQEEVQ